jgi:hypothetical protein
MNPSFKTVLGGILATGLLAGLTGCLAVKVTVRDPHKSAAHRECCGAPSTPPETSPEGRVDEPDPDLRGGVIIPNPQGRSPSVVAGNLNVPLNWFTPGDGGNAKFPASQGWDRYYVIITNFIGTSVVPDKYSFTNIVPKQTNFTVTTCNPHNGSSLVTGILTFRTDNPTATELAVTNAGLACPNNQNLSTITRTMLYNKKYRAIVFYKSSTLGTNQHVRADFTYP